MPILREVRTMTMFIRLKMQFHGTLDRMIKHHPTHPTHPHTHPLTFCLAHSLTHSLTRPRTQFLTIELGFHPVIQGG